MGFEIINKIRRSTKEVSRFCGQGWLNLQTSGSRNGFSLFIERFFRAMRFKSYDYLLLIPFLRPITVEFINVPHGGFRLTFGQDVFDNCLQIILRFMMINRDPLYDDTRAASIFLELRNTILQEFVHMVFQEHQ